jgi:hypothetical protein
MGLVPRSKKEHSYAVGLSRLLCFGGCPKSQEHSAKSKATEFPLFHFSHMSHGCACFVAEPGQHTSFIVEEKASGLRNGWAFLSKFGSGPFRI